MDSIGAQPATESSQEDGPPAGHALFCVRTVTTAPEPQTDVTLFQTHALPSLHWRPVATSLPLPGKGKRASRRSRGWGESADHVSANLV